MQCNHVRVCAAHTHTAMAKSTRVNLKVLHVCIENLVGPMPVRGRASGPRGRARGREHRWGMTPELRHPC